MSLVNHQSKEINCKIVYCGPAQSGKTTNLRHIYNETAEENRGKLVDLEGERDRTLFFDFLPLALGKIRGYQTRFHLYSVPGDVFYESSRRLILRGVDGVVFVADSQASRMQDNIKALEGLLENLSEMGYRIENLPLVLQFNKRDLPNLSPVSDLARVLNRYEWQEQEAIASQGKGVFETLKTLSKLVLMDLRGGSS